MEKGTDLSGLFISMENVKIMSFLMDKKLEIYDFKEIKIDIHAKDY